MSTKESILVIKLKDGIQDTVVFLRMLEQFKIPAVMETRRKKLLEKLLHLQGDTIREAPPSYENDDGPASPCKESSSELSKRVSVVETKVSEYARIETKAKEMSVTSPKKTAAAKPSEMVEEEPEKPPEEVADYLEPATVVQRREKEGGVEPERPVSTASGASSGKDEQVEAAAAAPRKKRFGTGGLKVGAGGLKGLRNRIGKRKKSGQNNVSSSEVAPAENATDSVEQEAGEGQQQQQTELEDSVTVTGGAEGEKKEEEEGELEEGVRILSELEKRVPKRIGKSFNWIKIMGKLKGTTLFLMSGPKEKQLELVGCMVSPSDAAANGIELFSHKEQKQWVFRVETSDLRKRWVEELQKAIDDCPTEPNAPPPPGEGVETSTEEQQQQQQEDDNQEKPGEDVPAINIQPVTTSDEESVASPKKPAASPNRAARGKPVNEIPEQGVQMKGYVHRKKGTFGGWEKTYAVVTYAAIYFTSGDNVREYHHVCMLSGSGSVKVEKKGHDKQSEGLLVKSGKNKETLSLPSSEVGSWKQAMEDVLGVSQGNLELESEDEGEGAESATPNSSAVPRIEEDLGLYEELPAGEEIEEDIYEEFDEVKPGSTPPDALPSLPPPRQVDQRGASPALPRRNDRTADPTPSLPPRLSPSLPPRNSPTPTPQLGKKSPRCPSPAT